MPRSEEVIETLETFVQEAAIHVEEQVVNVLHRDLEVFQPELEWK